MHGISLVGVCSTVSAFFGSGMNGLSGSSGTGFNLASLTNGLGQSVARGVSATGTASLGSQTISTLLQTQDLSQTQIRGGGHGGSHHGMKVMAGLETEETVETEEASTPQAQKRTSKTASSSDVSEVDENEEESDITSEGKDLPQTATSRAPNTNQQTKTAQK